MSTEEQLQEQIEQVSNEIEDIKEVEETKPSENTENVETQEPVENEKKPEEPDEKKEDTKQIFHDKVQKRINKEVGKRKRLETEKQALEKQLEEYKTQLRKHKESLTASDFDTFEEFEKHQSELIYEKAKEDAIKEVETKRKEQEKQEKYNESVTSFTEAISKTASKYNDFYTAVDSVNIPEHSEIGQAIIQGKELGAEIMYYLGKNPDVKDELLSMDTLSALKEIGKLEVKLAAPQKKQISKASDPIPKGKQAALKAELTNKSKEAEAAQLRERIFNY